MIKCAKNLCWVGTVVFSMCLLQSCWWKDAGKIELSVNEPVVHVWNTVEERWDLTIEVTITEVNGVGCNIESVWCDYSYQAGANTGEVVSRPGGRIEPGGVLFIQLEGSINTPYYADLVVNAAGIDDNGYAVSATFFPESEYQRDS
jgi:hypothetical protein